MVKVWLDAVHLDESTERLVAMQEILGGPASSFLASSGWGVAAFINLGLGLGYLT